MRERGAEEPLAVAVDANGLIAMVGTQEQVLYLNPTIIFFIFNLIRWSGRRSRFFILILPLSFLFLT